MENMGNTFLNTSKDSYLYEGKKQCLKIVNDKNCKYREKQ